MKANALVVIIFIFLFGCNNSDYTSDGNLRHIETGPFGSDGIFLEFEPVEISKGVRYEYDITGLMKGRVPYTFYFISNEDHRSILDCVISYEYYIEDVFVSSSSNKMRDMLKTGPYPHPNYYFKAGGEISIPQKNTKLRLVFNGDCGNIDRNIFGFVSLRSGGGEK